MPKKNFGSYGNLTNLFTAIGNILSGKPTVVPLTTAEYNQLTEQQKMDPTKAYYVSDMTTTNAPINDNTPSSESVYSSSKVVSLLPVWTAGVTALTGATSCTITNSAISSSSVLEVFFDNTSGTDPVATVSSVSGTTATVSFDALAEDTVFYLRVTNL